MKVFNELRSRGVNDILIAVVDGLKGLADALTATFPQTTVQTCIVHLIRSSLDYTNWKERSAIAAALRPIYSAATLEAAQEALEELSNNAWGKKYPTIVQSWRRAWEHVIPFFAFPPEVRRIIYTTNMIESLHMQLRKIIKNCGHFPNDEAAIKPLWLALRSINDGEVRSAREWKLAMNQFAVLYGIASPVTRVNATRLEHTKSDTSSAMSIVSSIRSLRRHRTGWCHCAV